MRFDNFCGSCRTFNNGLCNTPRFINASEERDKKFRKVACAINRCCGGRDFCDLVRLFADVVIAQERVFLNNTQGVIELECDLPADVDPDDIELTFLTDKVEVEQRRFVFVSPCRTQVTLRLSIPVKVEFPIGGGRTKKIEGVFNLTITTIVNAPIDRLEDGDIKVKIRIRDVDVISVTERTITFTADVAILILFIRRELVSVNGRSLADDGRCGRHRIFKNKPKICASDLGLTDGCGCGCGSVLGTGCGTCGDVLGTGCGCGNVLGTGCGTCGDVLGTGCGTCGDVLGTGCGTCGDVLGTGCGCGNVLGTGCGTCGDVLGTGCGCGNVLGTGCGCGNVLGTGCGCGNVLGTGCGCGNVLGTGCGTCGDVLGTGCGNVLGTGCGTCGDVLGTGCGCGDVLGTGCGCNDRFIDPLVAGFTDFDDDDDFRRRKHHKRDFDDIRDFDDVRGFRKCRDGLVAGTSCGCGCWQDDVRRCLNAKLQKELADFSCVRRTVFTPPVAVAPVAVESFSDVSCLKCTPERVAEQNNTPYFRGAARIN